MAALVEATNYLAPSDPALETSEGVALQDREEEPLEVNYDSVELTYLYQAIQDKAFMAAIDFLENTSKAASVRDECRTWVTRYEENEPNKIRWSQLPLHTALLFKAPTRVVELLVQKYPKAVRCTNDQQMLPLHLAFRYGASDAVFHLLLKEFPDAMKAADHKGRHPLDHAKDGETWKKGEIISIYMEAAKQQVLEIKQSEQMEEFQTMIKEKDSKIADLERSKTELKDELETSNAEVESLKKKLETLKTSDVKKPTVSKSKRGLFGKK